MISFSSQAERCEISDSPAFYMSSGRDIYAAKFASDLEQQTQWLQFGAEFKALSVEQLCRKIGFSPRSVIEVGAGTGAVLLELKRRGLGCEHTAVDFSADALAHLSKADPEIKIHKADITAIPFKANYDLAVCTHVLEHLEHPEAALASIGKNIIAQYYIFEVPLEDLFFGRIRNSFGYRKNNPAGHVQFYSANTFRTLISHQYIICGERMYFPKFSDDAFRTFLLNGSFSMRIVRRLTQRILPAAFGALWTRMWYGHMAVLAKCRHEDL